jgi:hypothetical protein
MKDPATLLPHSKAAEPERVAMAMQQIASISCPEEAHLAADRLLCAVLLHNGYTGAVDAFCDMTRWYS